MPSIFDFLNKRRQDELALEGPKMDALQSEIDAIEGVPAPVTPSPTRPQDLPSNIEMTEEGSLFGNNLLNRKVEEQPLPEVSPASRLLAAGPVEPKTSLPSVSGQQNVNLQSDVRLDPYGAELGDEALKAAQASLASQQQMANIIRAGDMLTQGFTQGRLRGDTFADTFEKQGQQGITNIMDRRSAKDKELGRQKAIQELSDETQMRDPNSDVSKSVREGLKRLFPDLNLPDNVSAMQLKNTGINFGTLIAAKENADARRDAAQLSREQLALQRESARETKEQTKIDKDIDNYSKRAEKMGLPAATQTLQEIDNLLSGGLDATKGDVPGYGLAAGALPSIAVSDKGQKLRQAVQRLANIELKDRSGAAVTDQEFKRFKEEFGTGTFKTEAQLLNGLRQYRNVLARVSKELEAATPRKALEEYKTREGAVTSELIPGASKGGQKATRTPQAASGGTVTVRRKSDGAIKTLAADAAKKYLNDPAFEEVK